MRVPWLVTALLLGSTFGCQTAGKQAVRPAERPAAPGARGAVDTAVPAQGSQPVCRPQVRALSAARPGVRPYLAVRSGEFAVVWEQTGDEHRSIRFQALDQSTNPLGPSIEIADLKHGGAAPLVVADGNGYVVVWTVDQLDTSAIALRRVDRLGKPRSDVVQVVAQPGARALGLGQVPQGFVVVWWTRAKLPHVQMATWIDAGGRPLGPPVLLSRAPSVDPTVDVEPLQAGEARARPGSVRIAWEELVAGIDHVIVAEVGSAGVLRRVDIGPGDTPSFGGDQVFFEHLGDQTIWYSPKMEAQPRQIAEGHSPEATRAWGVSGRGILCFGRLVTKEQTSSDELVCAELEAGKLVREQHLASAARGVIAVQAAATSKGYGVAYQTEEERGMAVSFAAVTCPP